MTEPFTGKVEIITVGTTHGELIVRDKNGREVFWFGAQQAALSLGNTDNEGDLRVFDKAGNARIHLDGQSGDIELLGADCAEYFDLAPSAPTAEPGTVMVLDANGYLCPSAAGYDRRVMGVVSGARGLGPGIVLNSRPGHGSRAALAMVGKTYCRVDADHASIEAGDLLTTSATPGHAMKATDPERSFGAVLGKALGSLAHGHGLVPIVVALQ